MLRNALIVSCLKGENVWWSGDWKIASVYKGRESMSFPFHSYNDLIDSPLITRAFEFHRVGLLAHQNILPDLSSILLFWAMAFTCCAFLRFPWGEWAFKGIHHSKWIPLKLFHAFHIKNLDFSIPFRIDIKLE